MAPTEVLAQQHARTLDHLFSRLVDPPKVVLLTGREGGVFRPLPRPLTLSFLSFPSLDI